MTLVIKDKETNRKQTHWNVSEIKDQGSWIYIYYHDNKKVVELLKSSIEIDKLLL